MESYSHFILFYYFFPFWKILFLHNMAEIVIHIFVLKCMRIYQKEYGYKS